MTGFNLNISGNGKRVLSVYNDDLQKARDVLGKPDVKRASNVEWDENRELWVAKLKDTGEILAEGPNRAEVVKEEVRVLNERHLPKMIAAT